VRSRQSDGARISMDFSERVVIIDTSGIKDHADYGGMLYTLKARGLREGEAYQIDNAGDLLMNYRAYERCRLVLRRFGAKAVNPS
jgi:hypothetical protein